MVKTLIVGLGNRFVSDDGAGPRLVEELFRRLPPSVDIEFKELCVGGMRLMEEIIGYDRVFIFDALLTGKYPPGEFIELDFASLPAAKNICCAHDTNLPLALEMAKKLGLDVPQEIRIFGIEAGDVENFSEKLTENVANAIPHAVNEILEILNQKTEEPCDVSL